MAGIVVIALVILFTLYLTVAQKKQSEGKKATADYKALANVNSTRLSRDGFDEIYVSSVAGNGTLALNWSSQTIGIGDHMANDINLFEFGQIRGVEVEVDGATITTQSGSTSTKRGSQVAGAAVGGLILGPAGFLMGGLSGGKKVKSTSIETKTVRSVSLVIRVSDRAMPLYRISFFDAGARTGAILSYPKLVAATKAAYRWHALITQAKEEVPAAAGQAVLTTTDVVNSDVADQITRLWKLHEAGALSETEFTMQKMKLLSS